MKKKDYRDILQNLTLITQVGLSIISPILLGLFIGQFIDKKIGANGIFSIIFIVIGVGAGFLNMFKLVGNKGNKRK